MLLTTNDYHKIDDECSPQRLSYITMLVFAIVNTTSLIVRQKLCAQLTLIDDNQEFPLYSPLMDASTSAQSLYAHISWRQPYGLFISPGQALRCDERFRITYEVWFVWVCKFNYDNRWYWAENGMDNENFYCFRQSVAITLLGAFRTGNDVNRLIVACHHDFSLLWDECYLANLNASLLENSMKSNAINC